MYRFEKYNEETEKIINQFIEDFQDIFPNKLSDEEIIKRINVNLIGDIDFTDDLTINCMGDYNLETREMRILKKQEYINKTIFHEFIHVMTRDINDSKDNKYLSEVLTSLAEEKYCEHYGIELKQKRVNAYVPDFGHQLQIVFGDELLDRFLKEPGKIYLLFDTAYLPPFAAELVQKGTLKEFAKYYSYIISNLGKDADDIQLLEDIENLENLILSQLRAKITSDPSKNNLYKLERLYNSQFQPDYYLYIKTMDQQFKKGNIKSEDVKSMMQLCDLYNISEKDSVEEIKDYEKNRKVSKNNSNFISHKIFGYDTFLIDEPVKNSLYTRRLYKENSELYETLTSLILDDSIDFEDIKKCNFSKEDAKDEINDIRVLLRNGQIDGYEKLINALSREKTKKYFIYDEDILKKVIEENILFTNMKSEDFCKQVKDKKLDVNELGQFLTKNNIKEVFCDDYYLDELNDVLASGDEYDFFVQDKDKCILKVSMDGKDKISVKYDMMATTVPNPLCVQNQLNITK